MDCDDDFSFMLVLTNNEMKVKGSPITSFTVQRKDANAPNL